MIIFKSYDAAGTQSKVNCSMCGSLNRHICKRRYDAPVVAVVRDATRRDGNLQIARKRRELKGSAGEPAVDLAEAREARRATEREAAPAGDLTEERGVERATERDEERVPGRALRRTVLREAERCEERGAERGA